jgi:hypothetical protein
MAKRTIRRRMRKSRTIRKVMRGCNGRGRGRGRGKRGGQAPPGTIQGTTFGDSSSNSTNVALQGGFLEAKQAAGNTPGPAPPEVKPSMFGVETTTTPALDPPTKVEPFGVGGNISSTYSQVGGSRRYGRARTRHQKRKLKYKKSVARKSRRS